MPAGDFTQAAVSPRQEPQQPLCHSSPLATAAPFGALTAFTEQHSHQALTLTTGHLCNRKIRPAFFLCIETRPHHIHALLHFTGTTG